jgi:excisionase family DNA binding protein
MENVVFTQLSIPEIRQMFRQELETYFATQKQGNTNQPEPEQLLTVQQAAELLNLSVPTLYGYTQRAEIPVCKRGKRLYFSKQSLFEWIKDGRKKTLAETASEAETYLKKKGGNNG